MNKQEALEAMLAACRKYEQPDGMRSEPDRQKAQRLLKETVSKGVKELSSPIGEAGSAEAALVEAGGMILALLVDEEG